MGLTLQAIFGCRTFRLHISRVTLMNSMKTALLIALFSVLLLSAQRVSAFYDPGAQRWLNRDPVGEAGGVSLYTYVSNNPINAVDPLGLKDLCRADKPLLGTGLSPSGSNAEFLGDLVIVSGLFTGLAGGNAMLEVYGARILAWLGLGAAAAANPQTQRAMQPMLAAINQAGQVILNPNLMLSHRVFAERALGITSTELPPGVWIGTVGTVNGQITALNSISFYGNMSPASSQIQQAVQKAVQCLK